MRASASSPSGCKASHRQLVKTVGLAVGKSQTILRNDFGFRIMRYEPQKPVHQVAEIVPGSGALWYVIDSSNPTAIQKNKLTSEGSRHGDKVDPGLQHVQRRHHLPRLVWNKHYRAQEELPGKSVCSTVALHGDLIFVLSKGQGFHPGRK